MEFDELPPKVRAHIEKLARKKPKLTPSLEGLLAKRKDATPANRATLDEMILGLSTRSRIPWIFVGIAGFAALMLGLFFYQRHRVNEVVARGTPTTAQVERLTEGNCLIGTKTDRCLEMVVKLHPAGKDPYSAKFTQLIPRGSVSRVQPGSWLTLTVDPADPARVALDTETLDVAPPPPPPSAK